MKGNYDQECNRTACSRTPAKFYNFSTRKYYCGSCAGEINAFNKVDTLRIFGHNLCVDFSQLLVIVEELFPKFEGIEELDTLNEEDFSLYCHSIIRSGGISMQIRNDYMLWDKTSSNFKYFQNQFYAGHPDDMSGIITKAIWRKHHNLL